MFCQKKEKTSFYPPDLDVNLSSLFLLKYMAMQFQQLTISSWNVRGLGDKIEDSLFFRKFNK